MKIKSLNPALFSVLLVCTNPLLSSLTRANASPPDFRKAVYSPVRKCTGGETGNGGDATIAAIAAEIAARAASEVRTICQNHPELRSENPCLEEVKLSSTLLETSWIPAEKVYLCAGGEAVLGGLPETSLALIRLAPCTERDAVNFGPIRNAKGKQVIVVSRSQYSHYLGDLESFGRPLTQNILHETLSLMGADQSDSYSSSVQWLSFLSQWSRLNRIYHPLEGPSLVSLYLDSDLGNSEEQTIFALLAQHRFVKARSRALTLYTLSLKREAMGSSELPDGSRDYSFTAVLERNSDQSLPQTVAVRTFRYNSFKSFGELPSSVKAGLANWLISENFPQGIL